VRFEKDLVKDVLEIITVLAACLCGLRSQQDQRLLANLKAAAENPARLLTHQRRISSRLAVVRSLLTIGH
jgi:hypothetical protein